MGWMGAMSGLGQGMVNYSGTMREQQKMDWKAQQDSIAAQRATNLENLRASNQNARAKEERTWRSGEAEATRTFQGEQGALKIKAGQENITEADRLARERIPIAAQARSKGVTDQIAATSAAKIKDVEAAFKLTKDLKATDRENRATTFLASEEAKGLPEERRDFLAFAIRFPQEAQMMADIDKGNKRDTEQFVKVFLEARKEWDAIDKNGKKAFQLKFPGVEDPNELKDLYARSVAIQGTGIAKGITQGSTSGGARTTRDIKEAYSQGIITSTDLDEQVKKGKMTQQQKDSIVGGQITRTSPNVDIPPKKEDPVSNTMMSPPTGPEREGPNLGKMFYDKLGGALERLRGTE